MPSHAMPSHAEPSLALPCLAEPRLSLTDEDKVQKDQITVKTFIQRAAKSSPESALPSGLSCRSGVVGGGAASVRRHMVARYRRCSLLRRERRRRGLHGRGSCGGRGNLSSLPCSAIPSLAVPSNAKPRRAAPQKKKSVILAQPLERENCLLALPCLTSPIRAWPRPASLLKEQNLYPCPALLRPSSPCPAMPSRASQRNLSVPVPPP